MNSGDYDISALGRVVVDRNFQRVAIQCPDEFLGIVPDLAAQLESEVDNVKLQASTRAEGEQLNNGSPVIVVLADVASGTTCCVDDVAAEHYLADCIVHLGTSCQSKTRRHTSTLFCFPKKPFSKDTYRHALKTFVPSANSPRSSSGQRAAKPLVVVYDVEYHHALADILSLLYESLPQESYDLYVALARTEQHIGSSSSSVSCDDRDVFLMGRRLCLYHPSPPSATSSVVVRFSDGAYVAPAARLSPYWSWGDGDITERPAFFYVGKTDIEVTDGLFRRFMLRFGSDFQVNIYDPSKDSQADGTVIETIHHSVTSSGYSRQLSRLLMSRYALIEATKAAQTIGLVYATVGVSGHSQVYDRLVDICKRRGRQVVSVLIGKIGVAKLENFPEIDTFCIIACPQSTFVPNPRDYSKPIVSPFELEVALGAREWSTEYITEFQELLIHSPAFSSLSQNGDVDDSALGSRFTSLMRSAGPEKLRNEKDSLTDLVTNSQPALQKAMPFLTPLAERTFQGVELHSSQNNSPIIYEGLSGIASAYSKEPALPQ